jgi:hypothetical protein
MGYGLNWLMIRIGGDKSLGPTTKELVSQSVSDKVI